MPSHYESFGLVALEAMAVGTPVIASEVGGLAFLVNDGVNGFLVPSRDPEALAERIYTLLLDSGCRQELGRQARQHASQFGWPRIADQLINVYAEVLGAVATRPTTG
jgi:D-inositol-3-phosphate glycosyltransferase